MLEDGPHGLNGPHHNGDKDQDGVEDITFYGVDWDDMDNKVLMGHHYEYNPIQLENAFSTAPATLSEVVCTPPGCPLLAESIAQLNYVRATLHPDTPAALELSIALTEGSWTLTSPHLILS